MMPQVLLTGATGFVGGGFIHCWSAAVSTFVI
jgi:thioester reductase-like protein